MVIATKQLFRIDVAADLIIETKLPDEDEKLEINSNVWDEIRSSINKVWIRTDDQPEPGPGLLNQPHKPDKINIKVEDSLGNELVFYVKPSTHVMKVKTVAMRALDYQVPRTSVYLESDGGRLHETSRLGDSGIENGSTIYLRRRQGTRRYN